MSAADLIALALAIVAVALGVAASRAHRAHIEARRDANDWRTWVRETREQYDRCQLETDAAHAAEMDALQLRYERERDLADGRLRDLVRLREEIAGHVAAGRQQESEMSDLRRVSEARLAALRAVEHDRGELERLRKQIATAEAFVSGGPR